MTIKSECLPCRTREKERARARERERERERESARERGRELYKEFSITGGLGRRPRTDFASPYYGLIDRLASIMAKTFPDADKKLARTYRWA